MLLPQDLTRFRPSALRQCMAAGEPCDELVRELQEHTKQTTAPYKYPREIEFMEELIKTHAGKIKRTELRKRQ